MIYVSVFMCCGSSVGRLKNLVGGKLDLMDIIKDGVRVVVIDVELWC